MTRSPILDEYRYKVSALANEQLSEGLKLELAKELEVLEAAIEVTAAVAEGTTPRRPVGGGSLRADGARIRYVVGSSWSLLLLRSEHGSWAEMLPGREDLQHAVSEGLASPWGFTELAERMYPDHLVQLSTPFYVQADEFLNDIPFASLWLSRTGAEAPVPVLNPSGSGSLSREHPLLGAEQLVLSLLPSDTKGSSTLPGVMRELDALSEVLGDHFATVSVEGRGTIQLPAADVIHVAGHGWVSRHRPMASAISNLPFGSTQTSTGLVQLDQLETNSAPKLILLSACEVAGADDFGSGYSLALAYALHFDAPVIAPTEPVDDGDASVFIKTLVQHLRQNDIAEAFERTLRDTSATGVTHYSAWQLIIP